MRISDLSNLPAVGNRATWARLLSVHANTLRDAEARGHLQAIRTKSGRPLYSRSAILDWLGVEPSETGGAVSQSS
jgi:hypothetical protein